MAERKIGADTFRCMPMPATEALELLADLTRVVTGGADKLQDVVLAMSAKDKGVDGAGDAAKILAIEAIGNILQQNTAKSLRELLERVLKSVEIRRPSGYGPIGLDDDFSGNLAGVVPVASFALETQYADFFGASAVTGVLNSLRAAFEMMKFGASPQTSAS